jgi:hypothetical protein
VDRGHVSLNLCRQIVKARANACNPAAQCRQWCYHQTRSQNSTLKEEIMPSLFLQGDGFIYHGLGLAGVSSLAIGFDDTGTGGLSLNYLVLEGTTSVSIFSGGTAGGFNELPQLAEFANVLTTVTIKDALPFTLGSPAGASNAGDGVVTFGVTVASSLKLIDASATTGGVKIYAGATNTSSDGAYVVNIVPHETITYTGLTIKGGSGNDIIENDAKNGIVTDGNGADTIILAGAGAKATLGNGAFDVVFVGHSDLGTNEAAGSALGDSVTFGAAATASLVVDKGAEAGSTASTTSIGLTKVHDAAGGMLINFGAITHSSTIFDETAVVAAATTLTTAENGAVDAMAAPGVAYFNYHGNEYFVATNATETAVSSSDAIVKLVGVIDLHATNSSGAVTLHV